MSTTPETPDKPVEERVLWEGNPSMRPIVPTVVALAIIFAVILAIAYLAVPPMLGYALPTFVTMIMIVVFLLAVLAIAVKRLIRVKSTRYRITTQRVFLERGIFTKRTDELELERYKDVFLTQRFLDRVVGCGDIKIVTGDVTTPTVDLVDLLDPLEKKEMIRAAARERQAKLHIVRREEI